MGTIVLLVVLLIFGFAVIGAFSQANRERSDPEALHNLGVRYLTQGKAALSLGYFQRAANLGYAGSQFNLALFFEKGVIVKKNDFTAAHWFLKAAEQGLAQAQYKLGNCYLFGRGVKEDETTAVAWFRQASTLGYAEAEAALNRIESKHVSKSEAKPEPREVIHMGRLDGSAKFPDIPEGSKVTVKIILPTSEK